MFTVSWWYMLLTELAILGGFFIDPLGFFIAIFLCAAQALHFGLEDKNFFSFSCQIRYVLAGILAAGLWEPLRWIYWIPIFGLFGRLTLNYCLMARLMALLPWNCREKWSWNLFRKTIFSSPTDFPILSVIFERKAL